MQGKKRKNTRLSQEALANHIERQQQWAGVAFFHCLKIWYQRHGQHEVKTQNEFQNEREALPQLFDY